MFDKDRSRRRLMIKLLICKGCLRELINWELFLSKVNKKVWGVKLIVFVVINGKNGMFSIFVMVFVIRLELIGNKWIISILWKFCLVSLFLIGFNFVFKRWMVSECRGLFVNV